MMKEPWSPFFLLSFTQLAALCISLQAHHLALDDGPFYGWSPLLGCCIQGCCSKCKAAKNLFMQTTGKLIYTSSYHLVYLSQVKCI